MVAVQTIAGAALGVLGTQASKLPPLHPDPRIDAHIKVAVGLALLGLGTWAVHKVGWPKTVPISLGVGVLLAGAMAYRQG